MCQIHREIELSNQAGFYSRDFTQYPVLASGINGGFVSSYSRMPTEDSRLPSSYFGENTVVRVDVWEKFTEDADLDFLFSDISFRGDILYRVHLQGLPFDNDLVYRELKYSLEDSRYSSNETYIVMTYAPNNAVVIDDQGEPFESFFLLSISDGTYNLYNNGMHSSYLLNYS